jgi:hypothetical protein
VVFASGFPFHPIAENLLRSSLVGEELGGKQDFFAPFSLRIPRLRTWRGLKVLHWCGRQTPSVATGHQQMNEYCAAVFFYDLRWSIRYLGIL